MNILSSQAWEDWSRAPSEISAPACDIRTDSTGPSPVSQDIDEEPPQEERPPKPKKGTRTGKKTSNPKSKEDTPAKPSNSNDSKPSGNAGQDEPPKRKRGRPRLRPKDEEESIQQRRMQIRRAQQTHRLKKETAISTLQKRVSELEGTVQRMDDLFSGFHDRMMRGGLQQTEPELAGMLRDTASQFWDEVKQANSGAVYESSSGKGRPNVDVERQVSSGQTRSSHMSVNGMVPDCHTSHGKADNAMVDTFPFETGDSSSRYQLGVEAFPPPSSSLSLQFESHLSSPATYTYSFLESSFSRRLQRYCLEHAYRCFSNPNSDPNTVYRIFRLVSCIREREKMDPYFQELLKHGIDEPLEIWSLPFYHVGGAGTHYPRKDEWGNPVYPPNMRLPRRILGSLPVSVAETPESEEGNSDFLGRMGFGGEWFDSHDVEKYLEEKGIAVEAHASLAGFKACSPLLREGIDCHDPSNSRSTVSDDPMNSAQPSSWGRASLVFDIERFLNKLLQRVVILGRAPGFRKADVDAALRSTVRVTY